MKKKIFLYILLCFIGLFFIFGIGLKANAATYLFTDQGIRVNLDNDTTVIYFSLPYNADSGTIMMRDDLSQPILVLGNPTNYSFNGTNYTTYQVGSNRYMASNKLYAMTFDQTINRIRFYEFIFSNIQPIDGIFEYTENDIEQIELFNISLNTRFTSYIDIISTAYIKRIDISYNSSGYDLRASVANNSNTLFYANYAKEEFNIGYNKGYAAANFDYDSAFNEGYIAGQAGENAVSPVWNLFQGIFGTLGAIFSIELAPHVYIGYFFLVPLFFGVVGLILWIWRRH